MHRKLDCLQLKVDHHVDDVFLWWEKTATIMKAKLFFWRSISISYLSAYNSVKFLLNTRCVKFYSFTSSKRGTVKLRSTGKTEQSLLKDRPPKNREGYVANFLPSEKEWCRAVWVEERPLKSWTGHSPKKWGNFWILKKIPCCHV